MVTDSQIANSEIRLIVLDPASAGGYD